MEMAARPEIIFILRTFVKGFVSLPLRLVGRRETLLSWEPGPGRLPEPWQNGGGDPPAPGGAKHQGLHSGVPYVRSGHSRALRNDGLLAEGPIRLGLRRALGASLASLRFYRGETRGLPRVEVP